MPPSLCSGTETPQRRHLAGKSERVGITVARNKGSATGYCYGCGADLVKGTAGAMATTQKKSGYWEEKKQELKISKIKNWALCPRCKKLNSLQGFDEDLAPDTKMTDAFREEVSKIRQKEDAVVVLCVDAINVSGTLIRTIRNYVGGNPILVAITRCDLLPQYVWEKDPQDLKQVFAERAEEISPANVYLCTVEPKYTSKAGGVEDLASDLWDNLNGRDPYIVGAANIGKSTLTDLLISVFVKRGERDGYFTDRLSRKRLKALQESRVTKSALPGTTLQNIRVPCFEDHTQALWDTPGLLLDQSTKHFPIRDLQQLRAQRPTPIEPRIMEVAEKSFAVLICEKGDELPLLRMEIRLKRNAEGEDPVRLVWNSILDLDVTIVDIAKAREAEVERARRTEHKSEQEIRRGDDEEQVENGQRLSKEDKALRKAERKRAFEEKIRQEQKELGKEEWKRRQRDREAQKMEMRRAQDLAKLFGVSEVICEGDCGTDIVVADFGWLVILPPRPVMVKTFAPSTGVRVTSHAALAMPGSWGELKRIRSGVKEEEADDSDEEYDEELGWFDDEYDDEFGWFDDDVYEHDITSGPKRRSWERSDPTDPWEMYSGENVGWRFDADTRWSKRDIMEGWNPIPTSPEEENS